MCGDFEEAFKYFDRALAVTNSKGEKTNGILDALAQVRLAQGRLDDCDDFLLRIDQSIKSERDRTLYGNRYGELTRTRLLVRRGLSDKALQHVEYVQGLAELTDDRMLLNMALLTKAELLCVAGHELPCLAALEEVIKDTQGHSPETFARYLHVLSLALMKGGRHSAGREWSTSARRICQVALNVPAVIDFDATESALSSVTQNRADEAQDDLTSAPRSGERETLRSLAAMLIHTSRPELLAVEFANLLANSGYCAAVSVIASDAGSDQTRTIWESGADQTERKLSPPSRRILIGSAEGRSIELEVWPCNDFESLAVLNFIPLIVDRLRELERTRVDHDRRTALWPADDLIVPNGKFVISGHMRELMTFAQRVAKAAVNVLITGESGTGKEILARAIHDFSDRAQKPFVPFNCAAIPRDLLESQLFGHRRGAFTGADRDHAGLIRAAADGTLFLDEIGELSPELQPKLLRFLESGEISPLGDPGPRTVNVRVIAATNTHLEDSVRDGRFREDLFYRLNVVRLSIKPLRERRDEIPGMIPQFVAAAARESNKGHLEIAEETMERLLLYRWPGNVRQLLNEIRRIVALAEPNSTIQPDAISPAIISALPDLRRTSLNGSEIAVPLSDKLLPTLSRIEYEMIKAALRTHKGKVDAAARSLGISRKGLYLKRQRLGL
jgi:DNA-binding NtrC family response regulator